MGELARPRHWGRFGVFWIKLCYTRNVLMSASGYVWTCKRWLRFDAPTRLLKNPKLPVRTSESRLWDELKRGGFARSIFSSLSERVCARTKKSFQQPARACCASSTPSGRITLDQNTISPTLRPPPYQQSPAQVASPSQLKKRARLAALKKLDYKYLY